MAKYIGPDTKRKIRRAIFSTLSTGGSNKQAIFDFCRGFIGFCPRKQIEKELDKLRGKGVLRRVRPAHSKTCIYEVD